MAITSTVLIEPTLAPATATLQYTADTVTAIIDKFTVTNVGTASAEISVNLVTNLGVVSNSNLVVDARTVGVGETYTCPELIGHVLVAGDYISTTASAPSVLAVRSSGREITV